jgi:hypothetical protein
MNELENLQHKLTYLKVKLADLQDELDKHKEKEAAESYVDPDLLPGDLVVSAEETTIFFPSHVWAYVPTRVGDKEPFIDLDADLGAGSKWRFRRQLPEKIRVFRRESGLARDAINESGSAV